MISQIKETVHKDIKSLKRKYIILKIKWIFLFVLPIVLIVLAYQVSKQYLKIRMKDLNTKIKEDVTTHKAERQPEL